MSPNIAFEGTRRKRRAPHAGVRRQFRVEAVRIMAGRGAERPMRSNVRPDDILADYPPMVRALTERLRTLVRETIPTATETAYPVWRGIGYRAPECGYFCGIFPQRDHVKLGFEHGASLSDPDGLLEGSGKQVRYVIVRTGKDIRKRAIKKLLVTAVIR